jgi:phospholysine phosphohistidine inorganic pyrophosphate phosphatase
VTAVSGGSRRNNPSIGSSGTGAIGFQDRTSVFAVPTFERSEQNTGGLTMKAVLIDLDGVLYVGDAAVSGAVDTVDWLRDQGIGHRFLTNTTSRPRDALVEKLARMGIRITQEELITPPVAARAWLRSHGVSRVALFVPEATRAEFAELEVLPSDADTGAGAVVVGDLGEGWDFATLNRAFRLLMSEPRPRLLALGMTRYWRAPDGLRLDTGPYVAALREATGIEPVVLGKPDGVFFETALEDLEATPDEALMIGDDIRGDIDGAQRAGIRGILVRTGKYRPDDLEGRMCPHAVIDSIAELPAWWTQHS